jgi:hypothetical protein
MAMAQTVLYDTRETELDHATADRDQLWIPLEDLERSTGWAAKPEGLCQGDRCVPVTPARRAAWFDEPARRFDVAAFAAYLGHPVAHDAERGIWAFGPRADRDTAGASGSIAAPELRLPDLDGKLHALSDYRGRKVLLYSWASW